MSMKGYQAIKDRVLADQILLKLVDAGEVTMATELLLRDIVTIKKPVPMPDFLTAVYETGLPLACATLAEDNQATKQAKGLARFIVNFLASGVRTVTLDKPVYAALWPKLVAAGLLTEVERVALMETLPMVTCPWADVQVGHTFTIEDMREFREKFAKETR